MKKSNTLQCAACRKEIEEGMDVFDVQEGVVGLSGFVPLTDPLVFCSEECLRKHFTFAGRNLSKAPKRMP